MSDSLLLAFSPSEVDLLPSSTCATSGDVIILLQIGLLSTLLGFFYVDVTSLSLFEKEAVSKKLLSFSPPGMYPSLTSVQVFVMKFAFPPIRGRTSPPFPNNPSWFTPPCLSAFYPSPKRRSSALLSPESPPLLSSSKGCDSVGYLSFS